MDLDTDVKRGERHMPGHMESLSPYIYEVNEFKNHSFSDSSMPPRKENGEPYYAEGEHMDLVLKVWLQQDKHTQNHRDLVHHWSWRLCKEFL